MRDLRSKLAAAVFVSVTLPWAIQACNDDEPFPVTAPDASVPEAGLVDAAREDRAVTALPDASDARVEDSAPGSDASTAVEAGLNDGSAPVVPVYPIAEPYVLAADATFLYVLSRPAGIFRVAKDGSTSQRITQAEAVGRMSIEGDRIFFTTQAGEIKVVPIGAVDGAGETTIVTVDGGPLPVRFDGVSTVVFGSYGNGFGTDVRAVDLDGGNLRTVGTSLRPYDIGVGAGSVFVASRSGTDTKILQFPLDGGTRLERAIAVGQVSDFAERDGYMYWSTRGGTVGRVPLAGGPGEELVNGQGAIAGLAVDDAHVYFVEYDTSAPNGKVARIPRSGGQPPVTLASNVKNGFSLTVDATHVYWGHYVADGGVSRTLK